MKFIFLFCLLALNVFAQRTTPLENVIFKTDVNADFNDITNLNSVVFYKNGTNLVVDMSTFINIFKRESVKLVDSNNVNSYLFVSNSRPYLLNNGILSEVTINANTPYIRQYEPSAHVTNLTVYEELIIQEPSSIDDSVYSVTYQVISNSSLPLISSTKLKLGRFLLFDNNGILIASNIQNSVVTSLTP